MEILEKLFGSPARVRIMRLFLFNASEAFDAKQVGERTQAYPSVVRTELANMEKMGLIKKKTILRKSSGKTKSKPKKLQGYTLNEKFPYLGELESLLTNTVPLKSGSMMKKLERVGKLKLVVVAGVFTKNADSRVDLLLVGDSIKKGTLESAIKFIESEVGKELRYAAFETSDFLYRISVYDKLVKDILDYPHHRIIDRLGLK